MGVICLFWRNFSIWLRKEAWIGKKAQGIDLRCLREVWLLGSVAK